MAEAAQLAAKLQVEGTRLSDFFQGLDPAQWDLPVYTEGTVWTVRNTLAHLMTSERAFTALFQQIRDGNPGVSEDFVIDRYNASQQRKTANVAPSALLDSFREARAEMITWLSGIADSDLEREGRHPFLGWTSLRQMVKMVYIHNQVHYRDIRAALDR